jgi:hypothetical protein
MDQYLLSIESVRERCRIVFDKAVQSKLTNFDVDMSQLDDVVDYTVEVIKQDFGHNFDSIPPHGRWQHINAGGIDRIGRLVESWKPISNKETARRLVDLFVLSVLLDAGAGNIWTYKDAEGQLYNRSEGLAVASFDMFCKGMFSSDLDNPYQVDAKALGSFSKLDLCQGMQVNINNPLEGVEGRTSLLVNLGNALTNSNYFGSTNRPGNLVDYLLAHCSGNEVQLSILWEVLMKGLGPIWPEGRTKLNGVSLGDAWHCSSMPQDGEEWETIVPFHKLTQWLCYSLLTPLKKFLGVTFKGEAAQTGLPEYRNGGLLVDLGLLQLKSGIAREGIKRSGTDIPLFECDSDVVVEWRATTIGFLDLILKKVNQKLGAQLSLPQLLEAGTWKAGRRIAAEKRPTTKGPPIDIISDGTVF